MSAKNKRDRISFEPRQNKKKKPKKSSARVKEPKVKQSDASLSAIPDAVSKRMARRMAIFCGVPTALGMSSFFIFYWILSHGWLELPPYFVLFISFSLFGMGIVGLSYGIYSASWDEERIGGWLGIEEVKTNWGRTRNSIAAWRAARQASKED